MQSGKLFQILTTRAVNRMALHLQRRPWPLEFGCLLLLRDHCRCWCWSLCRFPGILRRFVVPCRLLSAGRGSDYYACALRPHVARTLLRRPVLGHWLPRWRHESRGGGVFRSAFVWTAGWQLEGGQLSAGLPVLLERLVFVRQRYDVTLQLRLLKHCKILLCYA